ncbi:MAG: 2OG-Fe(II) oxygenase [Hyphomonadaceae bacterium]
MSDLATLERHAAAGDAEAQLALGQALLIGRLAPYDPARALSLIGASCAQRHAPALCFHAALATLGVGRRQDFQETLQLLSEAAALGDVDAIGQAGALGGDLSPWFAPVQLRQHHAAPRIFTVERLLPQPACDWLIARSRSRLQSAPVKDPVSGQLVAHAGRSNSVAGSHGLEPDVVMQLACLRIAGAIQTPMAQQEPTNILHYAPGQEYRPHFDFVTEAEEATFRDELRLVGQRIATVLVYLNDGYDGGETVFPRLNWAFKGTPGDALIFWNVSVAGQRERNSLHAGAPVTSGEKWLLSKWVREKPVPLI